MEQRNTSDENAYQQEWAYVKGRTFTLNLLALGSLVVTFRLGGFIGNMVSSNDNVVFSVRLIFMWLAYMAVDWVLKNALAAASNVQKDEEDSPTPKSVMRFAAAALVTTLGLSLASNPFISSELAGKSYLPEFNQEIVAAIQRDSTLKMEAFAALKEAGEVEDGKVQAAYRQKKVLVAEAVAKGSKSWKNDYQLHKNNPKAWFWTCQKCPSEYKAYREGILAAIQEGDKLIANAQGYSSSVQATLSPTLSYSVSQDTFLLAMKGNVQKLEKERQTAEKRLNTVLLVMTIMFGGLSVGLTIVLRDHRKQHGQLVPDGNVRMVMIVLDMSNRLGEIVTDIIYTLILQPFNYLKRKRWIKSYKVTDSRSNATVVTTANNLSVTETERTCDQCGTNISHKRSDARFCSDMCRMQWHNFVPHKTANK